MQYDLSELMRLARSPAGQQLIALLQERGGTALQDAAQMASSGNLDGAKQILSSLLAQEDARTLLKKLEEAI
ncbi:MAG: hypothetical protein IJB59_02340 [Oscillospiraceae bacterium]|nr:hypothetical protein [Oscillospiraceae bacterium]